MCCVLYWTCFISKLRHGRAFAVTHTSSTQLLIVMVTRTRLSPLVIPRNMNWDQNKTEALSVLHVFVFLLKKKKKKNTLCVYVFFVWEILSLILIKEKEVFTSSVSVLVALGNVASTCRPCHFTSGGEPTSVLISDSKGSESRADSTNKAAVIHHS